MSEHAVIIAEVIVFTSNVLGRLPCMALFLFTSVTSGGCVTGTQAGASCHARGEVVYDAARACQRLSGDQIENILRRALAAGYIEPRSISRHGVAEELILASDTVNRVLVLGYVLTERAVERGIVGSAGMEVLASCMSPVFAALAVLFYPSKIASDNEIRCAEEVPLSPGEPQKEPEPERTFDPVPLPRRHPNQTCDDVTLDRLELAKQQACYGEPWSCSDNVERLGRKRERLLPCATLLGNIARGEACFAARQRIQDECFRGSPEDGHDEAIEQITGAIRRCREKAMSRGCF